MLVTPLQLANATRRSPTAARLHAAARRRGHVEQRRAPRRAARRRRALARPAGARSDRAHARGPQRRSSRASPAWSTSGEGTACGAFAELPGPAGRRARPAPRRSRTASRTRRGSPAITNPDNDPGAAAVRGRGDGRAGRLRRQTSPRRSCAGSIDYLNGNPHCRARSRVDPATGDRGERLMSTINPQPHRARACAPRARASRRGSRRRRCATSTGCSSARRSRITALGLLMIYSTTHQRIPGDPLLLREAPGAVRRRSASPRWSSCMLDRLPRFRDLSMLVYGATVVLLLAVLAPIGSNIKGHQAWFQLRAASAPAVGARQVRPDRRRSPATATSYRGELDAWRLTVIIGLRGVPIGLVLLQPDLGTVHGPRRRSSWRCSRWPA